MKEHIQWISLVNKKIICNLAHELKTIRRHDVVVKM